MKRDLSKFKENGMYEEAIKRINLLKQNGMALGGQVRKVFEKGSIPIFENQGGPFKAVFYDAMLNSGQEPYDTIINAVRELEQDYGGLAYLVLISHTTFGTCIDCVFVGKYTEEWEQEVADLKQGYTLSYCVNGDIAEFGSIGFKYDRLGGGIYRSA